MKIGIVTYYNIKNYGSVLQAFALQSILEQLGHQAVFLSVREQKKFFKLLHKIHVASVTILKCAFSKSARETHREIRALRKESGAGFGDKTKALFDAFIKEHLNSIRLDRLGLRRIAHSSEIGAFICGSDQIWSPLSVHLSGYKYLNFAPSGKRIAYAPSFGVSSIPDYNRDYVKKAIANIDFLSVREDDAAAIIRKLISKDVPVLLDPTLLMEPRAWRRLYASYVNKDIVAVLPNKYVICYFFDEPSGEICEKIARYADSITARIVVLSARNYTMIALGAMYIDAGPWEFLHIIDHSSGVFTNSFHGCVFALQFSKPLVVFERNHSEAVKQTSRIDTLLRKTELISCKCTQGGFNVNVTSQATEKLIPLREKSVDFLRVSLKKVSENE